MQSEAIHPTGATPVVLPADFHHGFAVNEFGFYCIPDAVRQREVCKLLLQGEVNEPRTLNLIRRLARGGDVISGGAFVGDFLPAISQALAPGALLHSFEPNPMSQTATHVTIALNRLANVRFHPVAVGEADGHLPFKVTRPGGEAMGGISRVVAEHQQGVTVEVPVRRLDDLVDASRRVSVLHLDVEGHEGPALQGATGIVTRDRPALILEATRFRQARALKAHLSETFRDIGYQLVGTMERNVFFLPEGLGRPVSG
ncbi:FkbM family methyltransferase [Marinovum sp.]|uniref:FkbM family methyltransferase n=1 Tax=Marinovum sp. TaxID=2024839 RepID=UPI002B26A980|nr:FkbM family methyltransferase [Marinovum sp.]